MYYHQFPTLGCVAGNGKVLSPKDNKAHLTNNYSEIISDREVKEKTASLLRWGDVEGVISVTYVNHFKPRCFGAVEKTNFVSCCIGNETTVVKNDKG